MSQIVQVNNQSIHLSKVSPKFLHSNSTSHTWAFGAFAELIDNAQDAKAREVQIDQIILHNEYICLSFQDDGCGMDKEKLYKMLSFGYCDSKLSTAIGKYGNGFKSGSMRLGKDALVFTRTQDSAGIGFLSQTYHEEIQAESIYVPMLHYSYPGMTPEDKAANLSNLQAILEFSPFESEEKLKKHLQELPKTGTKIIIYNLHKNSDYRYLELDFDTDPEDIRCPEIYEAGADHISKHRSSLREYCSILYLCPRMKIKLRGKDVKTKLFEKSLSNTKKEEYTPKGKHAYKITFGFLPDSHNSYECGMMLYTENRLIKPYEKVACQKHGKGVGAGVVGVIQAKFLTPTQNKQDFVLDSKYIAAMKAFNDKLKNYWNRNHAKASSSKNKKTSPDTVWVQCCYRSCLKWRRMPEGTDKNKLPEKWFCFMHPHKIECDDKEENHEEMEEITRSPLRKRSLTKRKSASNLADEIKGKRARQNTTAPPDVTLVSDASDEDFTTSTPVPFQSSSLPSSFNIPSTSSAEPKVSDKKLVASKSEISKAASCGSSKKLVSKKSVKRGRKITKSGAKSTLKRKSGQSSSISGNATKSTIDRGYSSDDGFETTLNNELRPTKNVDTTVENEDRHGVDSVDNEDRHDDDDNVGNELEINNITESTSSQETEIQNLKECIKDLKNQLNKSLEWKNRYNNLLTKIRQLLEKLAPDQLIGDDVDMEKIISEMLNCSDELLDESE